VAGGCEGHGPLDPAPKLTDETARLYYRCKALHGRASATLLEAAITRKREHSSGVSVETAFWLARRQTSRPQPSARLMEPSSQEDLPLGALTPNHPLWRAVAKAMGRWAPAPKLTEEAARLHYRCKALHKRASAKLLEAERPKSASASLGGAR